MALFNKIFSLRKKTSKNISESASSGNGLLFSETQVRILLFRECDFQSQKLLFDSNAVQRISADAETKDRAETDRTRKKVAFDVTPSSTDNVSDRRPADLSGHETVNAAHPRPLETSSENRFEYQLAQPGADIEALGEIVFGSVALTYRGTSLKIHRLEDGKYSDAESSQDGSRRKRVDDGKDVSKKIMCTHIFCPPVRPIKQCAASSKASQSTSSSSAFSDCVGGYDAPEAKDPSCCPLDVPKLDAVEADSGYSAGEQSSYSSVSSGGPSFFYCFDKSPVTNGVQTAFDSTTLDPKKGWMRDAWTSLDNWPSVRSAPNISGSCSSTVQSGSFGSSHGWTDANPIVGSRTSESGRRYSSGTEDSLNGSNSHGRRSKLALTVIVDLLQRETELERYLFENMTLLETMLWRLRDCVYRAYRKRSLFLSIMVEGSLKSALWLRDVLCPATSPARPLWSRSDDQNESSKCKRFGVLDTTKSYDLFWKGWFGNDRNEPLVACDRNDENNPEFFVRELCELIDTIDTKNTNFFLSALLTAVLSNHLGWIIPYLGIDEGIGPCSALWIQLVEMHGVVGNPPRSAHTIITGLPAHREQMVRISNVLVYFIRYCEIERNIEKKIVDAEDVAFVDDEMRKIDTGKDARDRSIDLNISISSRQSVEKRPDSVTDGDVLEMTLLGGHIDKCEKNGNTTEETLFDRSIVHADRFYETNDGQCSECLKNIENKAGNLVKLLCESCLDRRDRANVSENIFRVSGGGNGIHVPMNSRMRRTKSYIGDGFKSSNDLSESSVSNSNDNLVVSSETVESKPVPESDISLPNHAESACHDISENNRETVVFVLGDDDRLVGLKSTDKGAGRNSTEQRPAIFEKTKRKSTKSIKSSSTAKNDFQRSQSVPPEDSVKCIKYCKNCHHSNKYSGVKFNFEQYPQIATNYMISKNLEIENHPLFVEKAIKLGRSISINFDDFLKVGPADSRSDCKCSEMMLQTPSNASELEFASYLVQEKNDRAKHRSSDDSNIEDLVENHESERPSTSKIHDGTDREDSANLRAAVQKETNGNSAETELSSKNSFRENSKIRARIIETETHPLLEESDDEKSNKNYDKDAFGNVPCIKSAEMKFIELPLSKSYRTPVPETMPPAGYSHGLIRAGIVESHYVPGAVLQCTTEPIASWASTLRRDLALAVWHGPLDQPVFEAVCVVANVDRFDVQILSNGSNAAYGLAAHRNRNDDRLNGAPVGPSQLVADMLESVLQLWKSRVPAKHCLQHIENRLHEFYVRSFALSELLVATDFCDMTSLTSALGIHPDDVPLLLAVASVHTPRVTQKYSVGFQ